MYSSETSALRDCRKTYLCCMDMTAHVRVSLSACLTANLSSTGSHLFCCVKKWRFSRKDERLTDWYLNPNPIKDWLMVTTLNLENNYLMLPPFQFLNHYCRKNNSTLFRNDIKQSCPTNSSNVMNNNSMLRYI